MEKAEHTAQVLRINDVIKLTGLSRSTIYSLIKKGLFPAPFKLASRISAWLAWEIHLHIEKKAAQRG